MKKKEKSQKNVLIDRNIHFENIVISPQSKKILENVRGSCLEIIGVFEIDNATSFGFKIFQSKDSKEAETIGYDIEKNRLFAGKERHKIEFSNEEKQIRFHIFIDESVIEVFLNYKECLTSRIYPKSDNSDGIDLFTTKDTVKLNSLDIWKLKSIW